MGDSLILGIDVGTSHLKAAAYDLGWRVACSAGRAMQPMAGAPTGERDPDALWQGVKAVIAEIGTCVSLRRVVAIGIGGMAESGCLIDAANEPLTPMYLWHDRGGTRQAAAMRKKAGPIFAQISGLALTNVRSLAKWRWLADSGAPRDARWCGAPEWIALCLTGQWLTDWTLAVRTGAFDVLRSEYSHELLRLADAPLGLFPPADASPAVAGTILPEIARDLGLSSAVQVVIAGHDDIVAAYGAGGQQGDLINSAGTAESLIRIVASPPSPAETAGAGIAMARYYSPASWALVGGSGATGALMRQVAEMLGSEPGQLDLQAAPSGRYAPGVIRVRLSKRSLPVVRIAPGSTSPEIWSALLDIVCRRTAKAARRLKRLAGPPARAILIGGAAHSRDLSERKSRALSLPVVRMHDVDATTRGAAALAALACGLQAGPFPMAED